jgi:signal transduction histidine kinase
MIRSLRFRLALVVGLSSLLALTGAGAILVSVADERMHDTIRDEAIRAAQRSMLSIAAGLPVEALAQARPGEPSIIRVGTDAAPNDLPPPLAEPEPGEIVVDRWELDGNPAYVAVAAERAPDGQVLTLAAAAPLAETERTLTTLRRSTAAAVPILAVMLGILAAAVTSRALRPVAHMRAEADAISQGTLHQRLSRAKSSELAELAETMNDMLGRLERASASQQQFLSDVTHELRSPLATIRGAVELAISDYDTLLQSGPVALAEIDRLDDLVLDLTTLARLDETGRTTTEEVDLDDIVTAQAATVSRPGVVVDTSGVRHARVAADPREITGLVRNLLDNAARHATSRVTLGLRSSGDFAELIVDDDGTGIPTEHRQRVFDRFARLDEGRSRDIGGTGLGLAVVAAAAHAHGGTVNVDDAPTGGARFVVSLPAGPSAAPGQAGSRLGIPTRSTEAAAEGR